MSDYTIVITNDISNIPASACEDGKWFACEPGDGAAMSNFWDLSHGWEEGGHLTVTGVGTDDAWLAAGGVPRAELAEEGIALNLIADPAVVDAEANEVWLTDPSGKVILRLVAE